MTIYLIYFLITLIFIFLIYIAFKAGSRGMEAKNKIADDLEQSEESVKNLNISNEIEKLKKLYDEGALSKEEFEKAKEKVINN
tara:strand:- start:23163 stop:23411 length:249 start_codon:yes stop_codon:yes gene_type:complete